MRSCWVYIDGVAYEKGTEPQRAASSSPAILGDLPDVVSPIDGTIIRGRAGLRDHCRKHNVVLTEDLKGLPTRRPVERDRTLLEDIKETMIKKGYWDRKNEYAK